MLAPVFVFQKDVTENGNRFGIDTARISVWGQGTGGYVAANLGALDSYSKIPTASDGKFLISTPVGILPMVIEGINGNLNATSAGIVPPGFGALLGFQMETRYVIQIISDIHHLFNWVLIWEVL